MGVPRFFKYISERYPCVIAPVTDATIPTVHNLYLDMNGIIHNCTQTETAIRYKINEKELVMRVFQYIDKLFSLVQPTQYFFMAVDGMMIMKQM
jgi:5'-3' exoribonuclease 1